MKKAILLLIVLLVGCKRSTEPIEPIESEWKVPPISTSFLRVETDGVESIFVEGEDNIEISGRSSSSTQHKNQGMGGGFFNKQNGHDWGIQFYFSEEELTRNTGNFTRLFDAGRYDFIQLDRNYNYVKIRGVETQSCTKTNQNTCVGGGSTAYQQQQDQPQLFEVTKAYFYNLTYDRFIWVEGTFDCWLGNAVFGNAKRIKGTFRIKVQHDLQQP